MSGVWPRTFVMSTSTPFSSSKRCTASVWRQDAAVIKGVERWKSHGCLRRMRMAAPVGDRFALRSFSFSSLVRSTPFDLRSCRRFGSAPWMSKESTAPTPVRSTVPSSDWVSAVAAKKIKEWRSVLNRKMARIRFSPSTFLARRSISAMSPDWTRVNEGLDGSALASASAHSLRSASKRFCATSSTTLTQSDGVRFRSSSFFLSAPCLNSRRSISWNPFMAA
mmetsp:Transcript_3130/g.12563  ORF Transcript_3130/g.12563 Transcript_3130/m.12563 type:complete len:222 (+) Transcript_3130:326-991(+)